MGWNADSFLSSLKARGQFPTAYTGAFSDAELLSLADEEIMTRIAPLVVSCREEFWVKSADTALVASTSIYRMHARAMASSLRDVTLVVSGNEVSLPIVSPEEAPTTTVGGNPYWPAGAAITIRGEHIVFLPTPSANVSGTLRQYFVLARPLLVPSTSAGSITGVDFGTKVVTCANVPTSWTTSLRYDLTRGKGQHDIYAFDEPITAITTGASGTLTFTNALPAELGSATPDYVHRANQTYLVPLPQEVFPLLVSAVLVRVLMALGSSSKALVEERLMEQQTERTRELLTPRVDGEHVRLLNRSSPLRWGRV